MRTRVGPATAPDEPARYFPPGTHSYFRIEGADQWRGAADGLLARQLGIRRLFLLDDGAGTGLADAEYTATAARALGVRIAGRASWNPGARTYTPLVNRIAHTAADAVFVAGCMCENGVRLFTDIHARLGRRVRLLAPDAVLDAMLPPGAPGKAAQGMYVSVAGTPTDRLSARDRSFVNSLRAFAHLRHPVDANAVAAAQSANALLDAVAHSPGTRSSVIAALQAGRFYGPLGPIRFDRNGDPTRAAIAIYRVTPGAPRHGPWDALSHAGLVAYGVIIPPARLVADGP